MDVVSTRSAGSPGPVADWPARIGRYEIIGRLATGGMAEILLGRLNGHAGFERAVVVKRILPHLARQPEFTSMFVDEARIAAQIRSENVVQVYELGQADNEVFIVQEYLEGESTFGLIRRFVRAKRRLPPVLVAAIIAEAAAGLQAAHELTSSSGEPLGVVHRDVSPENVFITYQGAVKVLDFGVALARDRLAHTQTGNIKGKFGYMSPEQCRGGALDRRSDLFSLGIVMHELTTGARLFKRASALATVQAICSEPIPRLGRVLADMPPALDRVCARALERNPEQRFQSAADFREALLRAIRSVGPDDTRRDLALLMNAEFQDRILEKRQMLERVAEQRTAPAIPIAEADADVDVPSVKVKIGGGSRLSIAVVAAVVVAVSGIGGALYARHARRAIVTQTQIITSTKTSGARTGELPSPQLGVAPEATPTMTSKVHVDLHTEPSGAQVFIDNTLRGETPFSLELSRGSTPTHLVFKHNGYTATSRDVVPDEDRRVQVTLPAAHRTRPQTTTTPPTVTEPSFHRF